MKTLDESLEKRLKKGYDNLYSQIDIKLEITMGESGLAVGYVIEGYDASWGFKRHLASDVVESVKEALRAIRKELDITDHAQA